MDQLALDLLAPPLQPSFDNFVVGRNAEAVAALRALVAGQAAMPAAERSLYLWGEAGSGRSHLIRALEQSGAWRWTPEVEPEGTGISVLDGVEALDDAGQIALFNRLNEVRADARSASVVTGRSAPAQLVLREDLRTRLGWGLVYQLHALSDEEKLAALRAHVYARGVHLAEDLLPYLLTHLPRDLRSLTAALDALDAFALARQRALTVPLLKEWLAQAPGASALRP
jgi:DnaA family protein